MNVKNNSHLSVDELCVISKEFKDLRAACIRASDRERRLFHTGKLPIHKRCHWTNPITKHKWHIVLVARNSKERRQTGCNCYLPYQLDWGTGFVVARFRFGNSECVYENTLFDFGPHVVDRYKQRFLKPNGMDVENNDEVIYRLAMLAGSGVFSFESNSVNMYWTDGAVMGDWHNVYNFVFINTFISKNEMYDNQKYIVDTANNLRGDINTPCPKGKEYEELIAEATKEKCDVHDFSPFRAINMREHIEKRSYMYAMPVIE